MLDGLSINPALSALQSRIYWAFSVGLSGAIYGIGSTIGNAVPLAPDSIQSEASRQSYSSIKETAASTDFTTSIAQCTATLAPDVDSEDENIPDEQDDLDDPDYVPGSRSKGRKLKDPIPDTGKPKLEPKIAMSKYSSRKFESFYDDADNSDLCENVMNRHTVKINMASTGGFTFDDNFNRMRDMAPNLRMWHSDGNRWTSQISKTKLPVYVVNAVGQSPGVACNALKFLAKNHLNKKYFSAFTANPGKENYGNPGVNTGIMSFVRANRFERENLYKQGGCKPAGNAHYGWVLKTAKGDWPRFEADKFPPSSANVMVADPSDITFTCVPSYDNLIDGKCLNKFLNANSATQNYADIWASQKCDAAYNGILDYTDLIPQYMQRADTRLNRGGRSPLEMMFWSSYNPYSHGTKPTKEISDDGLDKSAFAVFVNTLDIDGKEIDCSMYEYGTPLGEFYRIPEEDS